MIFDNFLTEKSRMIMGIKIELKICLKIHRLKILTSRNLLT
jgi:hypothetical protein